MRRAAVRGRARGTYGRSALAPTIAPTTPFLLTRTGVRYATLQGAVNAAQSGDVIKVAGGNYTVTSAGQAGDPQAAINLNTLTIEWETAGVPAVIDAAVRLGGADCITMNPTCLNLTLRGIHIRGARQSGNYAGVYCLPDYPTFTNPASLTMEYCKISEFANGILTPTGNAVNFNVTLNYCTFQDNGAGDGLTHGIYCGPLDVLTVLGCTFKTTSAALPQPGLGHLLKSRARTTTIRGSKFDPAYGCACAIEISNGGAFTLTGNIVFHYGSVLYQDENPIIKYGAEQTPAYNPASPSYGGSPNFRNDGRTHSILMAQNTLRKVQPAVGSAQLILRTYVVTNVDDSPATVTETVRNNIAGSNTTAAATFATTYPSNTAVVNTTIADSGVYSGGLVAGNPVVNDAAYSWGGELALPLARSDTFRGGLQGISYSLPSNGQAIAINANTAQSVRPSSHSSDNWLYAVFQSYGGGTFVSDYSAAGAYVIAGSGGHQAPPNLGAAIFDFSDASWKRLDNANGIANRATDFAPGEVNGEGEINGATSGQIPAPCHPYAQLLPLSAANGGGTKGSVVINFRAASTTAASGYSRSMRLNLDTGLWTRFSTNTASAVTGYLGDNGSACYDPTLNRYWMLPWQIHGASTLPYLPLSSPTWAGSSYGVAADRGQNRNCFVHDVARILVAGNASGGLRAINLNSIGSGWTDLSVSGSLPAHDCTWAYYPPDGKYYTRGNTGSVYQLTPPPSTPLSSQWTVTTVSFTGATLENAPDRGNGAHHNTRFFYVPSIQCLAWIPGDTQNVVIMRPTLQLSGLDFPSNTGVGTNAASTRFKFTGAALPPMYGTSGAGLTYLWKYRPRQQTGYYTNFFWANDDGAGNLNTFYTTNSYYGFHPYPPGSSGGTTHNWEISVEQQDFQNGAVVKGVWYAQGARVRGASGAAKEHEYYWNLPATDSANRVTRTSPSSWGNTMPPSPALTFGDAPWSPTNETASGIQRGYQIYNTYLTTAQMAALSALETDTQVLAYCAANGLTSSLWYLNMNPANNGDISDKSGNGRNPAWLNANRPTFYSSI